MVEIFKSPLNIQKSADVRLYATSTPIAIDANSSVRATITFSKPFTEVPFVLYSVICADDIFELSHYLVEVRTDAFIICIENQATTARTVKIAYEAKSAC